MLLLVLFLMVQILNILANLLYLILFIFQKYPYQRIVNILK